MNRVAIIGYGMGNIASLYNAFKAIEAEVFVAETANELERAERFVLPGVGAFPKGMEQLHLLGFDEAMRRLVMEERRPLLGVCLGMQLLASVGEEHRLCDGLGFLPGRVVRFETKGLRLPHIGWNDTVSRRENPLLEPVGSNEVFYYVHSYHLVPEDEKNIILTSDYGIEFVSGVQRDNVLGVQFHPEKSHQNGLNLLRNFMGFCSC
jgi:glutamine amidotransferase